MSYSSEGYHQYGAGARPGGLSPDQLSSGHFQIYDGGAMHFALPNQYAGQYGVDQARHAGGQPDYYGPLWVKEPGGQWTLRNRDGSYVMNQTPAPEPAPAPPPGPDAPPAAAVPPPGPAPAADPALQAAPPPATPAASQTIPAPPDSFNYDDLQGDPGYQFRLAEGEKRSAAPPTRAPAFIRERP